MTEQQQNGIRQRKNKKNTTRDKKTKQKQQQKNDDQDVTDLTKSIAEFEKDRAKEVKEPTLSSVFFSHPLVRVGQFVLLPYLIFLGMNYVSLQHPEYVEQITGGIFKFRPAVNTYDERQVLIVSASIGENKIIATTLSKTLGLEIAHETFDSMNFFCRDGSVSWYEFIRFLGYYDTTPNDKNENTKLDDADKNKRKLYAYKELCFDRNSSIVSHFFHPKNYAPSQQGCSTRESWSNCWSLECVHTIQSSWDCTNADNENECNPPFRKVLHATRNPLVTVEALNRTYCTIEKIEQSFLNIISGFFPHRDWLNMPSCLEAVSWYTLDFESTMLKARKNGDVVDAMFKLESTSPCEVAAMAGFTDPTNALYTPHMDRLTNICHLTENMDNTDNHDEVDKKTEAKADQATSKHAFVPRVPKSLQKERLTWEKLEDELKEKQTMAKNIDLVQLLKKLADEMGYGEDSYDEAAEFI